MTKLVNPKISVITVVLNGAQTLEATFDSVLMQDYPNLELIVIDGGSTDGTLEVINHYAEHIAYWETGKDKGITDAFNRGIAQASGDLVAILNSDDEWLPHITDALIDAYRHHPDADIFYGDIQYLNPELNKNYVLKAQIKNMPKRMSLFHPCLFVKREAYRRVGSYSQDYKYAMDCQWLHRAMNQKLKFHHINIPLAQMRLGGISDRHYIKALNEYRLSLLESNLISAPKAAYYFIKYALFKSLMRFPILDKLKHAIYKRVTKTYSLQN